ncbi:hypothetical protein WA1_07765 [Scytonema hofmannii PCC 7110]|uniref:Immunity protein 30 domain-containing protein n=1 Tax=Scytonema hofmannii PCC 7110 TaxID=128403 RepID=A0A139WTB8_9CYAN|nr:Imm30 family immunity protein [Scytonema hofmannii]KYC35694.1 hypothetical protein WA1_07765 [Scytonema hofmannii PCC 7110]
MDENTLLSILKANKLMRYREEITAFENALMELAENPNSKYLRELHLVLDDKCQHQEVMFGLIHFLESFDVKEQLQAFIDVIPSLATSAPEWTKLLHNRILNDELAYLLYQDMLNSIDSLKRDTVNRLLTGMAQQCQPVNT